MSLCLTKSELVDLTDYKQRRKQLEVLVKMKIPYRMTPAGEIKVIRSDVVDSAPRTREAQPHYGEA